MGIRSPNPVCVDIVPTGVAKPIAFTNAGADVAVPTSTAGGFIQIPSTAPVNSQGVAGFGFKGAFVAAKANATSITLVFNGLGSIVLAGGESTPWEIDCDLTQVTVLGNSLAIIHVLGNH